MLLDNNLITVSKEAVKKFGTSGAIILQILYLKYGYNIQIQYEEWEKLFDFIDLSIVKSTITKLDNKGLITISGDYILLKERTANNNTISKPSIFNLTGEEKPKENKKKSGSDIYAMAIVLCKVTGQTEGLYTPKRFMKFAKELINNGYTKEFIEKRYGKNGWWYANEFKGQKGSPPNESDIRKTISNKSSNNNIADKSNEFWS